jgi:hypothetical protein
MPVKLETTSPRLFRFANDIFIVFVSVVAVLDRPDRVNCRLHPARSGTLLFRVTVIVFCLHGQGVLCPIVPAKDGLMTFIAPPDIVIGGKGMPEADRLMS